MNIPPENWFTSAVVVLVAVAIGALIVLVAKASDCDRLRERIKELTKALHGTLEREANLMRKLTDTQTELDAIRKTMDPTARSTQPPRRSVASEDPTLPYRDTARHKPEPLRHDPQNER